MGQIKKRILRPLQGAEPRIHINYLLRNLNMQFAEGMIKKQTIDNLMDLLDYNNNDPYIIKVKLSTLLLRKAYDYLFSFRTEAFSYVVGFKDPIDSSFIPTSLITTKMSQRSWGGVVSDLKDTFDSLELPDFHAHPIIFAFHSHPGGGQPTPSNKDINTIVELELSYDNIVGGIFSRTGHLTIFNSHQNKKKFEIIICGEGVIKFGPNKYQIKSP